MANFARINSDNKVVNVVFVSDEIISDENGKKYEHWAFTHLYEKYPDSSKDYWVMIDDKKNDGYLNNVFDRLKDGFIPENPYPSWTLDENTLKWTSPVPEPILTDEEKEINTSTLWDESLGEWKKITPD